jgi:hypothetical protein
MKWAEFRALLTRAFSPVNSKPPQPARGPLTREEMEAMTQGIIDNMNRNIKNKVPTN